MLARAASLLLPRRRSAGPAIPPGHRVCAIGDIHGQGALFGRLLGYIDRDLAARPACTTDVIVLGNVIGRGPDSAGLVDLLRRAMTENLVTVLMGRHEAMAIDALRGRAGAMAAWLAAGGGAALASWGVQADRLATGAVDRIADAARAVVPSEVVDWLEALPLHHIVGDYLFVHAGIRPGIAIADQASRDLLSIGAEFRDSRADHGLMVVHGHGGAGVVEQRRNRIGIDTQAWRTGRLTALCLEDRDRWLIAT